MPEKIPSEELLAKYNFNEIKAHDDLFYFTNKLLEFHDMKIFDLGDCHKQMMDALLSNRFVLVVLPVGHLKTTIGSTAYALWRMWRQTGNYEMCITSSSLDQSQKFLQQDQYLMETTPWLHHLVPDSRISTWNKSSLITSTGNKLYVKPFNSSARGIQPNEILYDDLLRDVEGKTDVSMDDIKDTFWSVFFTRGQTKFCEHKILGTPQDPSDLYAEIEENNKKNDTRFKWNIIRMPAIDDSWTKPLWPQRFSIEELKRIRDSMGQYRFNREYLCNPDAAGASFYPRDLVLKATDDDLSFSYKIKGNTYIGVDYAMSESPTGDYNVFTVVEEFNGIYKKTILINGIPTHVEVKNPVIIKHIRRFKGSGQLTVSKTLNEYYNPIKFVCDKSSFGVKLIDELRDVGIPVEAQDFQSAARKQLLINLRRLFEIDEENKIPRIVIPTSQSDYTFSKTKILIKELVQMQEKKSVAGVTTLRSIGKHDDCVFSLAMACKNIVGKRKLGNTFILSADYYGRIYRDGKTPKGIIEKNGIIPGSNPTAERFNINVSGTTKKKKETEFLKDRLANSGA